MILPIEKKINNFEFETRNIGGSDVYYKRLLGNKIWSFSSKEEFEQNNNIMNKKYTETDIERGAKLELEEHKDTISKFAKEGVDFYQVAKDIAIDHLKENPDSYPNEDIISMNVPLFIRMLELAREDIKSDAELHKVVERVIIASKKAGYLKMEDYDSFAIENNSEESYSIGGGVNESKKTECINPKCDWSWDIEKGGDDKFICHKCKTDNEAFYKNGGLVAPNGKKSNLTPKQHKLVRTPEFISWFGNWMVLEEVKKYSDDIKGLYKSVYLNDIEAFLFEISIQANSSKSERNGAIETVGEKIVELALELFPNSKVGDEFVPVISKVVDENGEPLVCYHATDNQFWEFKKEKQVVGYYGNGFYFSNSLEKAKQYGKRVMPAFLNIKSVFELSDETPQELLNELAEANVDVVAMGETNDIEQRSKYTFGYESENSDIFMNNLIKNGYYGIRMIYNLESSIYFFIVFEPNQIKLADGTNITFDSENPDIRFEDGGEVEDLINQGIVDFKIFDTKPEHAKEYGLDSVNPLYLQSLYVDENQRLKGVGKKVLQYIDDYAIKNGHDVVFGHINQKATMTKDNRTGYFTEFTDIDFIKHWLFRNGYSVNQENNDFHKVIMSDSKDINDESKSDIRFDGGGEINDVKILGFTDEWTECDRCGKNELKGTYSVLINGNEYHLGSSCIAKTMDLSDSKGKTFINNERKRIIDEMKEEVKEKNKELEAKAQKFRDEWTTDEYILDNAYYKSIIKEIRDNKSEIEKKYNYENSKLNFEEGGKIHLNSNKGSVKLNLEKNWKEDTELVPVSELLKFREFNRLERPKYNLDDSTKNIEKLEVLLISQGVEEPLIIEYSVEDNSVLLIEGNHRLNVAERLGFDYLPARVITRRREFNPLQRTKSMKVKGFKADEYGYVPSNLKPSQVGISGTIKAFEEGGIIEGQLHSECNKDTGCGEKFDVGNVGHIIEAERDEAVIVSKAFKDNNEYEIQGTPSEIASALNVIGGGKNFDSGAIIKTEDNEVLKVDEIKKEAKNTDVKSIDPNSIIINRRSMYDDTEYIATGTPKEIASQINNLDGNGVKIVDGGSIEEVK